MRKKTPSMEALEILAVSDRNVFESTMQNIGLNIEGMQSNDPLLSQVQTESIASIASELTEDANTFANNNPRLKAIKTMAEDYGYIVSYA